MTATGSRDPPDDHATRSPDKRRKTTLFCPGCDHESSIDGDWTVRRAPPGRLRLICPTCGARVHDRPDRTRDGEAVPVGPGGVPMFPLGSVPLSRWWPPWQPLPEWATRNPERRAP